MWSPLDGLPYFRFRSPFTHFCWTSICCVFLECFCCWVVEGKAHRAHQISVFLPLCGICHQLDFTLVCYPVCALWLHCLCHLSFDLFSFLCRPLSLPLMGSPVVWNVGGVRPGSRAAVSLGPVVVCFGGGLTMFVILLVNDSRKFF
jgi:hypothetical protein